MYAIPVRTSSISIMVFVRDAVSKTHFAKTAWLLKNAQNVLEITIIIWIRVSVHLAPVSYKAASTVPALITVLTAQLDTYSQTLHA